MSYKNCHVMILSCKKLSTKGYISIFIFLVCKTLHKFDDILIRQI